MTLDLPINIDSLLRRRTIESERVEYKAGWNPEAVLHTLAAFANDFHNLGGGYVVLGLEELDGRPVLPPKGIESNAIDGIQKKLLGLGNSAIQPPYHPLTAVHEVDGKTILVLYAPGGEARPYRAKISLSSRRGDWGYYIRRHNSTVLATGQDERELIGLAATVPFDDRYHRNASLDDLSFRLIQQYLQDVGSDLLPEVAALSMEALGRRMNIVGGPSEALFPKNVGLLFFNDRPYEFFPATQIDVVWFPEGPGGDYFEEKEFRGPLSAILRDAITYIERNYLKEAVVKHADKPEADRFWNFPVAAIEEALANAIYHRSYEEREPVEVRITRNELLILSYPGADRSIRMDDLQQGKAVTRRYRNRRIGEFLKELDLAEGRSTGVPKILRAMRDNGSPPPSFETDDDRIWFMVRLAVHPSFQPGADSAVDEQGTVQDNHLKYLEKDPATLQDTLQDTLQVNDCIERLVGATRQSMSRAELQAALKLRDRSSFVRSYLNPALEADLIEMTLPDRPTSGNQRYRRTSAGEALARRLLESDK